MNFQEPKPVYGETIKAEMRAYEHAEKVAIAMRAYEHAKKAFEVNTCECEKLLGRKLPMTWVDDDSKSEDDDRIIAYGEDDLDVPCWEFSQSGWISSADYDNATEAQRLAIEAHEEFRGWEEQCIVCLSSVDHHARNCTHDEMSDEE